MPTYATWNPADAGGLNFSNGNLTVTRPSGTYNSVRSTVSKASGKWYWEITRAAGSDHLLGVGKSTATLTDFCGADASGWGYWSMQGYKFTGGTAYDYGTAWTTATIISVALDLDNGKVWFAKDGVWQASGDPAAGTNPAFSGLSGTFFAMASPHGSGSGAQTGNFGASAFAYSVPSGFNAGLYEDEAVTGTGASTAQAAASAGAGDVLNPVTGTGAATAQAAASAGAGDVLNPVTGTGAATAQAAASAGAGDVLNPVTGTGAATAQAAASAGAGDVLNPVTGTGAATAQAAASAGAGDVLNPVTGTGAATAQAAASAGAGTVIEVVTGAGAATAQAASSAGSGTAIMVVYGSGASTAQAASASGSGVVSGQFPIFVNPSYGSKEVTVREQLRSPAEAGYTMARAKFTRARRRYQLTWDFLSEEDYATLRTFFAVNQGGNFKWVHPVSAETITCQFMDNEFEGEFKSYGQRACSLNIEEV